MLSKSRKGHAAFTPKLKKKLEGTNKKYIFDFCKDSDIGLNLTDIIEKGDDNDKASNYELIHAGVQISLNKLFFAIKAFERNKYEDIEIEEMDNFDFIKVPRFDKIFFKKICVILNNRKENSTIYVEKNKERETILSLNLKNSGGINKSKKKIHQFNVDTYIKVENICKETYNEIFLNKIDDILEK